MQIGKWVCGSCAAAPIENLGEHANALDAMSAFCRLALGNIAEFTKKYQTLFTFYVFIAGPEVAAGEPGSSHHSKPWVKYGTEFAAFIEENKLGLVSTLPPRLNLKFHPKSTAQIWIWHPDQTALENWWKNQSK